jgi:hypothetical protein
MKSPILYGLAVCALLFTACGSSKPKYDGPSPVDLLMRDLGNEKSYSIILHDMQMDESKGLYQHKYKVFKDIDKDSVGKVTEWKKTSEIFFAENLDNMGLELASKSEDGKISKLPSPPGFNNRVNNPKYGEWRNDSHGQSFWHFYGQYAFMSAMMHSMHPTPVIYQHTYHHYSDYRNNPTTRNAPYYGTGASRYGTNSPAGQKANPSFFDRKQQQQQMSSFKQKVASNPARYSRASSNDNGSSSRTPRSSSRAGSSSRSRGGSFGK